MSINTDYQQYWALGQSSFWDDEEIKKVVSDPVNTPDDQLNTPVNTPAMDTVALERLQLSQINQGAQLCQRKEDGAQ